MSANVIGLRARAVSGEHKGLIGQIVGIGRDSDSEGRPLRAILRFIDGRKWKTEAVDFSDLNIESEAT